MVNTMDCSNEQPKWPRPKCSPNDKDYRGSINFVGLLTDLNVELGTQSMMKRIFVYDSDGHPQADYSISIHSNGTFFDEIGGGETNIYQLGCSETLAPQMGKPFFI